jgi:hypothetical protein
LPVRKDSSALGWQRERERFGQGAEHIGFDFPFGASGSCEVSGVVNSSYARTLVVTFWLWWLARHRVIMSAGVMGKIILPAVQSAEARYPVLGAWFRYKSRRLTKRAADVGESPRFIGLFLSDGDFPFLSLALSRRS